MKTNKIIIATITAALFSIPLISLADEPEMTVHVSNSRFGITKPFEQPITLEVFRGSTNWGSLELPYRYGTRVKFDSPIYRDATQHWYPRYIVGGVIKVCTPDPAHPINLNEPAKNFFIDVSDKIGKGPEVCLFSFAP